MGFFVLLVLAGAGVGGWLAMRAGPTGGGIGRAGTRPPTSRSSRAGLLALLAALVLVGCGGGGPEEQVATPQPRAPLTGELIREGEVPQRPALVVKIDNAETARPQVALQQADVTFEQIVEGGVTRFAAIFHSQIPERVGPVRSARLIDAQLLPAFSPILAFSGARDEVDVALANAAMGLLTDEGPGAPAFSRDPDRPGSHDLFADPAQLLELGRDLPQVAPLTDPVWSFAAEPPGPETCASPGGDLTPPAVVCRDGSELELQVSSSVTVDWDYEEGVYLRSQDGAPTEVLAPGSTTSERLAVDNVVALGMDVHRGGCCDSAGNPYIVTEVVGSGEGLVLRDGRAYPIEWSKDGAQQHLRLTTPGGGSFPLKPGRSWIHLMPGENLPEVGAETTGSATDGP